MTLLDDLPRGVWSRGKQGHSKPLAVWADPEKAITGRLAYDAKAGRQILLGEVNGQLAGVKDDRHIVTIAGSRAGKSVSLTANLLFYRGSVLAIDPKGELASLTARRRETLGQTVHVLDPFSITQGRAAQLRASFNPMAFLTMDNPTLIEDAGIIADALVISEGGNSDHWNDTARNFIEGLILHVALDPAYDGLRNLVTVRRLLMQGTKCDKYEDMEGLHYQMACNPTEAVQFAAADLFEKPPNEQGSVISTARRHTKFLDFPALQAVLQRHDFNLSDLKTAPGGMSVFLCLPAGRISTCSRWFRLFVNLVIIAMEREKTIPDIPVLIALDEFANAVGYLKIIEVAAGLVAGYGVKLWPILQDLGQLQSLYGDRWQTFLGNAGILQFFGNNDMATLEWISKRCGTTSFETVRTGEVGAKDYVDQKEGKSASIETCPLMTPEEAARFFSRDDYLKRQLIIQPGPPPLIISRVEWHSRPDMRSLVETLP